MAIEKIEITSREQWLGLRRNNINGSEMGALFGVHRFLTEAQLYALKMGWEEDDKESAPMLRGQRLESYVAEQVAKKLPDYAVVEEGHYYRDDKRHIGGTPDRKLVHCSGAFGPLEIKTVGQRDFVERWQGGDKDNDPLPEPWQLLQNLTYQKLMEGATFGKMAVLPISEWGDMDVKIVDVPHRPDVFGRIDFEVARFWRLIDQQIAPDFDFARDGDFIDKLYQTVEPGKVLDLMRDNRMRQLLDEREDYKSVIKGAEKSLKEVEAEIKAKLGDAESATVYGWKLTNKSQTRKAFTAPETTFRVLRATRLGKHVFPAAKVTSDT